MTQTTYAPARPEGDTSDSAGITHPCRCDFYEQNQELHDELLAFESRGVTGVEWLIDYLDTTEDSDPPAGVRWLHWFEWDDFVAEHNWADPLAVARLGRRLTCDIRWRNERLQVEDQLGRVEAKSAAVDVKIAEVGQKIDEALRLAQDLRRPGRLPDADLSDEHIATLVEKLPPELAAEIDATAELAEHLAWSVGHLLCRWEALEEAVEEAVESEKVWNGGDLVNAVYGRTRAHVTEEVLDALGIIGSMPPDNWRQVLEGHAVKPRQHDDLMRAGVTGAISILSLGLLKDDEQSKAVRWLVHTLAHGGGEGWDLVDAVVEAAKGVPTAAA